MVMASCSGPSAIADEIVQIPSLDGIEREDGVEGDLICEALRHPRNPVGDPHSVAAQIDAGDAVQGSHAAGFRSRRHRSRRGVVCRFGRRRELRMPAVR